MPKLFIFFILLFSSLVINAQKEWVNWNSSTGGLTFKNGSAKTYTDVPNNLSWPDYTGTKAYSYSDPLTGNMLFLTDGKNVWNKDYKSIVEPKQNSLISCDSDRYKVQIVPFANDPSKFYLFHLYSSRGYVGDSLTSIPYGCANESLAYLYYSVLQMDFTKNSGELIKSNIPLLKHPLDRITLIKHANKKDTWVIAHPTDFAYYAAFLVTDAGVQVPVISEIGPEAPIPWENIRGQIAASPNGKFIAASGSASNVEVYNFDNSTGKLSNYRTINFYKESVLSLCFSPDNSKLYITTKDFKACEEYSALYQIDFNEGNLNKSLFLIKKYPQRNIELTKAKDNRIWIKNVTYPDSRSNYFEVIEYPDFPKHACTIREKYLKYTSTIYLPNIINDYIQTTRTTSIKKLSLPDTLNICSGKISLDAGVGYENYRWNTGDTTRTIQVDKPGMYTVLAGTNGFVKPEAYGYVYVQSKAAEVFKSADTLFCPKTLHVLAISDYIKNIVWMDGDTSRIKHVNENKYKLTGVDINGCTVRDSICVIIHDNPFVSFGNDTTFCSPQSLQLNLTSYIDLTTVPNKVSSFLWQDSSTQNSFTVTQPGTYWGSIKFNGCTVADTININYISIPEVNLGKDISLCDGDSLSFYIKPSNANYLWNTGSTSNTLTVKQSDTYWAKVTKDICINADTVHITFNPLPVVSLPKDTVICEGTSLTLNTTLDPSYKYKWQNGDTTGSFVVKTAGTYSLQAKLNGCFAADTAVIGVMLKPVIHLSDTFFCKGDQLILDPRVAATDEVLWQNTSATHTYRITTSGTYSVHTSNTCGEDKKDINVIEKLCKIIMPNAFTPNGDNMNDLFRLKDVGLVRKFQMMVYNRLGQQIFETSNPEKGWDGTLNGIQQPSGTYVWLINYIDLENNPGSAKGYVVLLR